MGLLRHPSTFRHSRRIAPAISSGSCTLMISAELREQVDGVADQEESEDQGGEMSGGRCWFAVIHDCVRAVSASALRSATMQMETRAQTARPRPARRRGPWCRSSTPFASAATVT